MREIVELAASSDDRVHFVGRVPARREFQGRTTNAHSGGHFTPELNEYYARRVARTLEALGILSQ